MIQPKVGFVVFGAHKDGVQDALGQPFVDEQVIENAKNALRATGIELITEELVISTKKEARDCFSKLKMRQDLDALVVLFWNLDLGIQSYRGCA